MLIGTPTAKVVISSTDRKIQISSSAGDTKSQLLSVVTQKDLTEPSGSFQIQLTPEKDSNGLTWFDRINIWDFVEIDFKGILDDRELTCMRGLIDSVTFSEDYASGVPQRSIMVSGRDLGCLLTDFHIYMIPELGEKAAAEMVVGGPVWFRAAEKGFIGGNAYDTFEFLTKMFFEQIDLVISSEASILTYLDWDAASFMDDLRTYIGYLQGYQGPWWNAFSQYQDQPFHEMFVYDSNAMSWFILRPSRLKDANRNYHPTVISLMSNSEKSHMYPPDFTITNEEKISTSLSKHITDMYNYYLTIPTLNVMTKIDFRGTAIQNNFDNPENSKNPFFQLDKEYPSYMKKYGFRKKEFETTYIDLDIGQFKRQGQGYNSELKNTFVELGEELNRVLVAWFLHNPLLLSGNIQIAGTNRSIIGTYMIDQDEKMEYYVEGVNHNFVTLQSFTTNLRVSRGLPLGGMLQANKEYLIPTL